jgi:DNA-binding LacI/PurR family transcriptional regulator
MTLPAEKNLTEPDGSYQMELRPRERLLKYLLAEFDKPESKDGSRLPTNKELANRLGVSPGTVQSVLRQLARDGRVHARRGSGTFLIQAADQVRRTLRVGIGVPLSRFQPADGWMSTIAGGIFQTALARNIGIEGISDQASAEKMIAELEEKRSHLDALILFPYILPAQKESLVQHYEKAGKPVVHIYPPSLTATANFATTDFFGPCHEVGRIWKATGRRRIALLSNMPASSANIRTGVSNQLRWAGLANGAGFADGETATPLRQISSVGGDTSIESGYASMKQALATSSEPPDAIFCSGDLLALGAIQALTEAGISVPEQTSVVGGSGMDLSRTDCQNLTRLNNDLAQVGRSAMEMVLQRLDLKGIALPGIVVPATFIGGATTRPEENRLLGCS